MSQSDTRSPEAQAYRRLYGTARWRRTREAQLTKQPLCEMCLPRITRATVCDHVDPKSKASPTTFFAGPFASLCKPHHDGAKQRQERRGYVVGCDADGRPRDPNHPWNRPR